ncbi:hypothetical protein QBC41DRAFT_330942 [Cercophora samala]|uniref:Uncharacterized protein n=1 Tax=Cercophora samala TaxID=330535 RepID=A0AA40D2C5_9PEZI|nr:hypothetical protein QBC41DRAFT_330942 [Cercophora samala]
MIHSKGASAAFQRKPKIFNIEKVPSKPLFHDFGKCFGDFLFKIPIAIDALMAQQRRGQTNTQLAQHVGRMYLRGKCNSRKPDSDSDDEDNHPEGIYEDFALHYAKCLNKRVGRALTFYRKIHGFPARSTDLPYNPRARKSTTLAKETIFCAGIQVLTPAAQLGVGKAPHSTSKKKYPESDSSPTSTTSYPLSKTSTISGGITGKTNMPLRCRS